MNSILPVTAGWAKASGPRDKRIYFKLRAELLPENADLYTVLSVWTAWPPAI